MVQPTHRAGKHALGDTDCFSRLQGDPAKIDHHTAAPLDFIPPCDTKMPAIGLSHRTNAEHGT